jgi:hypothetical protein
MRTETRIATIIAIAALFAFGCGKKAPTTTPEPVAAPEAASPTEATAAVTPPKASATDLKTDKGVDVEKKVIKIGALNDESGPAAAIGKPFAIGKRLVAKVAGEMLPKGWSVELVERDHGYNPQKSVQAYNELKDEVLFIATSFGTPNTLPLRPMLARDKMMAFPASLSSKMAEFRQTPPLGPSYTLEAKRAMDWVIASAGDAKKVKAGIVYQQDDYGKDGLAGWKAAAEKHGVAIVSEQTVSPGQKDMAAVVTALKDRGRHPHPALRAAQRHRPDPRHCRAAQIHAGLDRQHTSVDRRLLHPEGHPARGVHELPPDEQPAFLGRGHPGHERLLGDMGEARQGDGQSRLLRPGELHPGHDSVGCG